MTTIYLDHASTTPLDPDVLLAMEPFLKEGFGDPTCAHARGREARKAVEQARADVARTLGADPKEIVFTSGGTEAVNAVLKGVAWAHRHRGNHLVVSSAEHPCVLESVDWLSRNGFSVTRVPVDREGMVKPEDVQKALRPETLLVSVMAAHPEFGTVQPLREIAALTRSKKVLFHTDAAQAYGRIPLKVRDGFDLLTASSHKFYGPRGAGFIYQKKGVELIPLLHGGPQERGRRAGAEDVAACVGTAKAAVLAMRRMKEEADRLDGLTKVLVDGLGKRVPDMVLHSPAETKGGPRRRLPGFVHMSVPGVEGCDLAQSLDIKGFQVSPGSADRPVAEEITRVLKTAKRDAGTVRQGLRITLGRGNTEAEVRQLVEVLPLVVERLRALSPLLED